MHFQAAVRIITMIVLCCGVGVVSGLFTGDTVGGWYAGLRKPPLNPPGWVFGVVWPILYIMMGAAAGWAWNRLPGHRFWSAAIGLFLLQLVLNGLWTPLFFKLHTPGWALVEIVGLWICIIATILVFYRVSKTASLLMLPYLAWVSFAIYLNAGFWILNR